MIWILKKKRQWCWDCIQSGSYACILTTSAYLISVLINSGKCSGFDFFKQLIVDPSGPAIDLHVPLLIIIGTIPLRSVVQQYQTQFGMTAPQPSALPPPGPVPSAPSAPPMAAAIPDMSNLRECPTQYLIIYFLLVKNK